MRPVLKNIPSQNQRVGNCVHVNLMDCCLVDNWALVCRTMPEQCEHGLPYSPPNLCQKEQIKLITVIMSRVSYKQNVQDSVWAAG